MVSPYPEEEEEDDDDGDAPPPSRWTRFMECLGNALECVSHASGGDATIEAMKEMAGNADTAAVNRAISTLQSHKARVARAQIAVFNKLPSKETVQLRRSQSTRSLSQRSPSQGSLSGRRLQRSASSASEVLDISADHGHQAAQAFLQRGYLCRLATLWPASHPLLKLFHFSMLAPMRASVALLVLKVTSAGALGAVFFSSGSPTPDSDPECSPPNSAVEQAIQSLTVGLVTALMGDVIISILFAVQVKKVVYSETEWTEEKKRRQHLLWSMRSSVFWLILLLYGGFCNLYICLFLANVTDADRTSWIQSMGVTLMDDLLVKSFLAAFAMATIATLVLCCRPQVMEKIRSKWIKDDASEAVAEPAEPHKPNETASPSAEARVEIQSEAQTNLAINDDPSEDGREVVSVKLDPSLEKVDDMSDTSFESLQQTYV